MYTISDKTKEFVKKELERYEAIESAIIPALYAVQKEHDNWVPNEAIGQLSEIMGIPESRINEVFHFYTMFNKEPVGKYHVQVCTNVACAMSGTREILKELCSEHGVKIGQVTADGRYCFQNVECLGSCGTAPMLQINQEKYNENLSVESTKQLLKELP